MNRIRILHVQRAALVALLVLAGLLIARSASKPRAGYWHQWHWWIVPASIVMAWASRKFLDWMVLPDGRWRWQAEKDGEK